jgi:catechol 2,3-dioxygenase-like lactoylglutathione lyase family enzyme
MNNLSDEDVGNIVLLEHVNLQVPDQTLATIYYILGLGLTRDPYFNICVRNMWANAGEQQFHLPVRPVQVLHGYIALVFPDLEALKQRLAEVEKPLADTKFRWSAESDHIAVTCPWGNRFRCYAPDEKFGDMALGIPYVEFLVGAGSAAGIARFYDRVLLAPSAVRADEMGTLATVKIGRHQMLRFRDSSEEAPPYDGHHIAIYVDDIDKAASSLGRRRGARKLLGPLPVTDGPAAGQSINYFGTPLGHYVELISYPDGMAYEKTAAVKLWSPKDVGRRKRH